MEYGSSAAPRSMILIADDAGAARGAAVARQNGLSLLRTIRIADAAEEPDSALAADLLFVEVGAVPVESDGYDMLLGRVDRLARGGRLAAIVAIIAELIDRTDAGLASGAAPILCNADAATRAAAVQYGLAGSSGSLHEDGPDDGGRLLAASEELERIARLLVDMAAGKPGGGVGPVPAAPPMPEEDPADRLVTAADFRRMLRERRLRDLYLGSGLFADPAWDMLLDLAAAGLDDKPVAVSSLCIAAAVPPTTALRWIQLLTTRGLLVRTRDGQDGRRMFITLAPETALAMTAYVRAARTVSDA